MTYQKKKISTNERKKLLCRKRDVIMWNELNGAVYSVIAIFIIDADTILISCGKTHLEKHLWGNL